MPRYRMGNTSRARILEGKMTRLSRLRTSKGQKLVSQSRSPTIPLALPKAPRVSGALRELEQISNERDGCDPLFMVREKVLFPVLDEDVLDSGGRFEGQALAAFRGHVTMGILDKAALDRPEEIEVVRKDDLLEMRLLGDVLQVLNDGVFPSSNQLSQPRVTARGCFFSCPRNSTCTLTTRIS